MTTTNSVFSTYKRMWVSRAVLSCQVFSCHPPSPPFSLSLLLQVTCRITRRFVLSGRMRRKIRSSPIRLLSIRENLINLIVIFAGVTSPNTTSRGNHGTTERVMSNQSSAWSPLDPLWSLSGLTVFKCSICLEVRLHALRLSPNITQHLAFQWTCSFWILKLLNFHYLQFFPLGSSLPPSQLPPDLDIRQVW